MRGDGALAFICVLALSGCGAASATRAPKRPEPSPTAVASATPQQQAAGGATPGQHPTGPGGASGGAGTQGTPSGGAGPNPQGPAPAHSVPPSAGNPDNGELGTMSRAFLRPAPYSQVTVEMDAAAGAAPDQAVMDNLRAVFGRETAKPVGQAGHTFAGSGGACWTDAAIAQATGAQRQVHTHGSTAALAVLFLDGTYCNDSNVLGLAYGASAMLIFTHAVENLATPTVPADTFLKSVTVHELGHVMGLVNIGYRSSINHEDPAHPHHSSNKNSVMYYAIDQGNLVQSFVSGPPQDYDSSDRADLAGLRNGTY